MPENIVRKDIAIPDSIAFTIPALRDVENVRTIYGVPKIQFPYVYSSRDVAIMGTLHSFYSHVRTQREATTLLSGVNPRFIEDYLTRFDAEDATQPPISRETIGQQRPSIGRIGRRTHE